MSEKKLKAVGEILQHIGDLEASLRLSKNTMVDMVNVEGGAQISDALGLATSLTLTLDNVVKKMSASITKGLTP